MNFTSLWECDTLITCPIWQSCASLPCLPPLQIRNTHKCIDLIFRCRELQPTRHTTANQWVSTELDTRACTVTFQHTASTFTCSSGWVGFRNTQISMLLGVTQKRNVRSKFWWFTRSCNSHYVSHFAAFFIVVGSKTSIAESCNEFHNHTQTPSPTQRIWHRVHRAAVLVQLSFRFVLGGTGQQPQAARAHSCMPQHLVFVGYVRIGTQVKNASVSAPSSWRPFTGT